MDSSYRFLLCCLEIDTEEIEQKSELIKIWWLNADDVFHSVELQAYYHLRQGWGPGAEARCTWIGVNNLDILVYGIVVD